MVKRLTGRRIISLRTDNGGEYTSLEFQSYLKREGIKHELTVPRSPEQNGVAELFNHTLMEAVTIKFLGRSLSNSCVPKK